MADQSMESLPRLADALLDVGTRLREISDELRGLHTGAQAQSTPAGPAVRPPGTAPTSQPGAQPGHPQPHAAQPGAAQPGHPQQQGAIPTQSTPQQHAAFTAGPPQGAPGYGPPYGPRPPYQQHTAWYPPPAPPLPPVPTLWERLSRDGAGSRILAWAGGVVTLLGVVLLLVLAIQRGYLGPLPRVLLGAGLGLALAGIGMRLHPNAAARTGAYALAATGIAVLYLDVVAATSLYDFLPPWGGLLAGLAVTGLGVALAGRWDSELLAVFVVVCCAVCAPILTEGFDSLLLAFLLVLLLGTTPVQLLKRWGGLALAAGLPPVVACVANIGLAGDHRFDTDATTVAIMCGVTSAIIVLLTSVTAVRRPDDDFALALLLVAPVPGLLAAILLPRTGAAILPAALGVLLLAVWAIGRTGLLPSRFALAAGGVGTLALLQATATAFDGDARAIALLAESFVLTMLAVRLRLKVAMLPAAVFGAVGLLLALIHPATPALVAVPPHRTLSVGTVVSLGVTGLVLAIVVITLCWAVFRLGVLTDDAHAPHGWAGAGIVALYGSTAAIVSIGLLISPDRTGFLLGHVLVTVSWTVGALVLLLRGIDSVPLRVAGLSLVVAALAKLVLFDLSFLDGMARVAAFLVAGLVLLAAGARYAKLVAARTRS